MHKFFKFIALFTSAYMFRVFFKPIFKRHCVQMRQWFTSPEYGVSARAQTPDSGDFNIPPNLYTVPLEDGLKENPKHVRQKQRRK
jgi:hypothetical protein